MIKYSLLFSHMVPLHLLSLFSYFSTWYRHLYYLDRDTGSLYLSGGGPKHLSRYVVFLPFLFPEKGQAEAPNFSEANLLECYRAFFMGCWNVKELVLEC